MANYVQFVEPTIYHQIELALNIRDADREEIYAASLRSPFPEITAAVKTSTTTYACIINGQVGCIFGTAPISLTTGVGAPWMLGTDLMDKHPRILLRECQRCLVEMGEIYSTLVNYVDARNESSIRWLKWLGFHVEQEPRPFGMLGLPFHRFEMRK